MSTAVIPYTFQMGIPTGAMDLNDRSARRQAKCETARVESDSDDCDGWASSLEITPRGIESETDKEGASPNQVPEDLHKLLRQALALKERISRYLVGANLERAAHLYRETVVLFDQRRPKAADVALVFERLGELLERIRHEESAASPLRVASSLYQAAGDTQGEASARQRLEALRSMGVFTLKNASAHHDRGKIALACQEWPTAIEAFRRASAILNEMDEVEVEAEFAQLDLDLAKAYIGSGDLAAGEQLLVDRIEKLERSDSESSRQLLATLRRANHLNPPGSDLPDSRERFLAA